MTRILLGGASLIPGWTGGEPLTAWQLVVGFRHRHHEVAIAPREVDVRGALALVGSPSDWDPLALSRYDRILRRERPEVVLGFYDYDSSLQRASQRLGIPYVACVHMYWPLCPIGTLYIDGEGVCSGAEYSKCLRHMAVSVPDAHLPLDLRSLPAPLGSVVYSKFRARQPTLAHADAVVVPSLRFKSLLESAGISPVRVVPCGVELAEFPGTPWVPGSPKVIVFPSASATERKGSSDFFRAAARVRKSHPEVRFVATNSASSPDVEGTPRLPREELVRLYQRSYAVVVPSLWDEVHSNVTLEAMAARRPVVAYRVGGVPELIVEGETGLLVPRGDVDGLADALVRLIEDEGSAERMGAAGRRRLEANFTVSRMVDGYLDVVSTVMSERNRPAA
jgi:glycosyltransferase involved in cell wall biosynthesis